MRYLVSGLAFLGLAACAPDVSDPQADSETFSSLQQINEENPPPAQLQGVWRSKGYGWIFEIDGSTACAMSG